MGTNYYWRPLVTEEEREKILEKVKNSKTIQEIKDFIYYDLLNERKSEIQNYTHGQSLKKEDIDKWFRSGVIFDEYGDEISVDDFWALVDYKKDDMDYDEYDKKYPEEAHYCRGYDQHIDGLRFTKDECEFS